MELALRHLDIAQGLLAEEPQCVVEATMWLDRSVVEHYLGHYEAALQSARKAGQAAARSGHLRHGLAALTNESFVLQELGLLNQADAVVARVPDTVSKFVSLHLAVLDNKSELRVLQGRLEEADALLQQVMDLAAGSPGLRNSWQHLAAIESRVRLLHLRGQSAEACALASEAEQDAAKRSDDLLRLTYRLLRASILVDSGDAPEAAAVIKDLVLQGDRLSKAQRVDLDRILAQYYAGQGNEAAARDHALRAVRLQDAFSNAVTKVQLRRTVRALGLDAQAGASPTGGQAELDALLTAREPALDPLSLKAVEQLGHVASLPDLLGREVLSVLSRSACVERATIRTVPSGQSSPESDPPDGQLTIPLGSFLGHRYFIDIRPRDDIASLETLVTIAQLARTAVRYNEAEAREAAKTALWRFEPVASEGVPVATSAAMQQVLSTVHLLATSDAPVLITGETGTGKEVFARELHRASGARGPFVPFNCSAVAADMLDAQLFGHRKGAFTSAVESLPGVVRSATGGTLFLDEIGELNPDLQPKLLRLLDRSEVHPLGEPHPITVRVRLVAATNAKVEELMAAGRFRADLFYRLTVARVLIPPLRERREEIPAFAEHFLETYARERHKARLTLSDEAIEALLLFRWPGNVRQLASEMRRLVTFCKPGTVVRVGDLSPEIAATRPGGDAPAEGPDAADQLRVDLEQPLQDAVDQLERAMIERALELEHGHRERAAERLGLSRKGLFLKLKRLGIEP